MESSGPEANANGEIGFKAEIRAGVRSYLSSWMLRSAIRSSAEAQEVESQHLGHWGSPHVELLADLVIGTVTNSAMFLEAMVNELFSDAYDGHNLAGDGYLAPLEPATIAEMADWWKETNLGFDKTVDKYQKLLALAGRPVLIAGAEPLQSAAALFRLRNALVHYKPATVFADTPHTLEATLRSFFPGNGLQAPGSGPWWPSGALGAGCAAWAVASAEALADEVASRLGLVPNYQRLLRGTKPPSPSSPSGH